jgi:agmatine deiminase
MKTKRISAVMLAVWSIGIQAMTARGEEPADRLFGPILVDGALVYPEGAQVPRYLTETERKWLAENPPLTPRAVTPPPTTGPIHCVAEYEPMEGLLLAWEAFTSSGTDILPTMIKEITTTANSRVYVVVDTASEQSSASSMLTSNGTNMSNVQFVVRTTDSVWIRDYGPRYIYQGQCRAVVDHTYNRPRPNDDAFSTFFANTTKRHAFYEHQLVHGGGNYHLDALDRSYATELIWNENPGLTHTQIHDIWQDYQNVDTHIFPPFPTSVDSTQHIDMWMQVCADNKVIISDWPNNAGTTQDVICDNAAVYMAGQGYAVTRVPARSLSGVHYTYTNVVMINNVILLPTYTNTTIVNAGHNGQALSAWQAAMPDKTIVQINCQGMISLAGVMHCIVMHVPKHLGATGPNGGLSPTAYLKNLRGGETIPPVTPINVTWISDDDVSVSNIDILLSTDGGATYDTIIASATADDGTQSWSPPNVYAPQARIKIVARDGVGNTGSDESPANFTINGTPVAGDLDCDARLTLGDVPHFVQALLDPSGFVGCQIAVADMDGNASINGADMRLFVDALVP